MASHLWYHEGLRFRCTRCGNCCRGAGNVWVSDDEIGALASLLEMSPDEFRTVYTRQVRRKGTALRQKRNQDCVFFSAEQGCQVYDRRPKQCSSYPFWSANVHLRENWDAEAAACPGIDTGPLYPAAEISATAADDGVPAHRTRIRVRPAR